MRKLLCLLLLFTSVSALAQKDEVNSLPREKILMLHELVGAEIDSTEKTNYHLFPFWKKEEFMSARIFQRSDNNIELVGTMKNGTVKKLKLSKNDLDINHWLVSYYGGKIKETPLNLSDVDAGPLLEALISLFGQHCPK